MATVSEGLMQPSRLDSMILPDLTRPSANLDMLPGLSGCLHQDFSLDLAGFYPSISGALGGLDKGNSLALLFTNPGLHPCGEVPLVGNKFEPVAKPSVSPLHSCSANSTQETFDGPAASGSAFPFSSSGFSISPFAAVQQPQAAVPSKEYYNSSAAVSGAGVSDRPSSSYNGQGMESSSMDRSKHSDMSAYNSGADSGDDDLPGIRRSAREATRASTMATVKRSKAPKEKKKVGRPIAYTGDPNAPHLSEAERRRVKRRIANRESARRVRMRKLEQVEELVGKMKDIQAHTEGLQNMKIRMEADLADMRQKFSETQQEWMRLQIDNQRIQHEIDQLQQTYQARLSKLEDAKRAHWNNTHKVVDNVLPKQLPPMLPWQAS